MKQRCPIRLKIESILKLDPMIHTFFGDIPRKAWIDKRKSCYRMKIFKSTATRSEMTKIEKLPHVIKTGYCPGRQNGVLHSVGRCDGVLIYFDCKPSSIKV